MAFRKPFSHIPSSIFQSDQDKLKSIVKEHVRDLKTSYACYCAAKNCKFNDIHNSWNIAFMGVYPEVVLWLSILIGMGVSWKSKLSEKPLKPSN